MSVRVRSKKIVKRALERAGIDPAALRVRREPEAPGPAYVYANGVSTELPLSAAEQWRRRNAPPLVVALFGELRPEHVLWMVGIRERFPAHFLVAPDAAAQVSELDPTFYTLTGVVGPAATARLAPVLRWVQRLWRRCDLLLIDLDADPVSAEQLLQLQYASRTYDHDEEVGVITPGYVVDDVVQPGFDFDRSREQFVPTGAPEADHGQDVIPRYLLTALAHGTLIRAEAVDHVLLRSGDLDHSAGLDGDVSLFVARGWQQNIRTLGYPSIRVHRGDLPVPEVTPLHREWLLERRVTGRDGRRRVIFVLNATSVSGGIRVVFEEAEGLAVRGFDVEIWALQEHPDWTDLAIPVTTFRNYFDLLMALRKEEAIKVATWWETQQVVWLASVVTGVPVAYFQEFEAWFYPSQRLSRAAVAASARHEFHSLTTGSYQASELKSVGLDPAIIPVGYDPRLFFPSTRVERRDDTLLAVGRSFFQKNFALTAAAWSRLGDQRPRMLLFGYEPDILKDERVDYVVRPSHRRVNELYNEATLFVSTSLHEGFGLPIIEAMAAGCPVITTDAHGNRDFCVDGENCILVPQGDPAALAAAIAGLIDDPKRRQQLSEAGLATAARYAWPNVLDELAEYYARIL
ncbi:glycosyltransferase family 4 protein [Leifsonia virtsii]|uniref:Glycosyltransferase family 4 protein n=1 Tax=Leifsonia virtsii TaxID=3035915 RepID=A0ABT8J014_9MICO|nr:glycosyltransferase family 4 protein [Leifsonia virtsii]MDN4598395.1 glycosyltransferase family 4 protein [Leifsonia virtsii]